MLTWMDPCEEYVPFVHSRHSGWPLSLVKVPSGQSTHELDPMDEEKVAGSHRSQDKLAFNPV